MKLKDYTIIMSYKIQIYPNTKQAKIIRDTCDACKFVYNRYLNDRNKYYEETKKTLKWRDYRKVIKDLRKRDEYKWLKDNISKHALDESLHNVNRAFERFFEGVCDFPDYKRKKDKVRSYYIDNENVYYNGNKIHLPIIGDVRISEKNYIPRDSSSYIGGCIIYEHTVDKYYLVIRAYSNKYDYKYSYNLSESYGNYGVDVGINTYAYISNKEGESFPIGKDLVKSPYITKLENRIDILNNIKSNKMEINKKKGVGDKNGWSNNCLKIQMKINKTYKKKSDYMTNYINQLVTDLVKAKLESITIESLDIMGLLTLTGNKSKKEYSKHEKTLHKHIQSSKFRYFYNQLIWKASMTDGLEIRQIDRFDASTQKCAICGHKHKIPLSTRVYVCDNPKCKMYAFPVERDYNSAWYLANCKDYVIL